MAIHLHTHSYYSFLHGITSPAELAEAAARAEMPALALTEAGTLAGAIEFYDACRAAGGAPIPGVGGAGSCPRWAEAGEEGQALRLLEPLQELYPDRLYVEVDGTSPAEAALAE